MTRVFFVCFVVALAAITLRVIPQPRTIDDAFITFRYARNLVEGDGFVYNLDERTIGTTTPLYTLLMAGISAVTGSENFPWFALTINAAADAGTAVLLVLLMTALTGSLVPGGALGLLWAVSPMSVTFAVGGMETSVVIFWSVAAAFAYVRCHERALAVFAALGVLTRVDTLIWIGPLFAHQFFVHWRAACADGTLRDWRSWIPWRTWTIFIVLLIPWYAFSVAYFGVILPQSIGAKEVAYHVEQLSALTRFLQHIATPFFENDTFGVPGIVVGIVLYPALALAGLLFVARRQPRLWPYLLYPWLYITAFSAANPLIFRWYLAPILPAYFFAIVCGVWGIAQAVTATLHHPYVLRAATALVMALFTAFSLNAWTLHPDHGPTTPAPVMAWHQIELYYHAMAGFLVERYGVGEDTLLAAGDIGAIGYFTHARILDTIGLVTPAVTTYYPLDPALYQDDDNYIVPPALIQDYQPDYIVFMEMFLHNGLEQDAAFAADYQQIAVIPTDFYGTGMLAFRRADRPVSAGED